MIRSALLCFALGLAGCASAPLEDTATRARVDTAGSALPPMKAFARPSPAAPARSNANIAADFLSLHFELESGRALPRLTRFESPISVRVTGAPPASLAPDLTKLLSRLRREAGIDIHQISQGQANITIQAVSRDEIRRALPQAACFVVPNVSSLDEYRRDRRKPKTSWSLLQTRSRLGIFIPNDTSPQEVRDCLHEELAQAIGPLNDLYRLPDSVFNDDNVHTVLTGFDMLILRATYAPELHSGMSQAQVANQLPGILARLNPQGNAIAPTAVTVTPRAWTNAVQTALGPDTNPTARRAAATTATRTAEQMGWTDHRLAFSHYMLGRMTQTYNPDLAQQYYATAQFYLQNTPATDLHQAYVVTQTAAYAVAMGDGNGALNQIRPMLPIAARSENAALLATLMMLQAEALDLTGQPAQAQAIRVDSLGWARYGFGSDWAVRAKMQEISALNPRNRMGG